MKKVLLIVFALVFSATSALAENWKIDPDHSAANFAIQHMMIAKVRGAFPDIKGTLEFSDGKPTTFNVIIAVDSLDTGVDKRDTHLKSGDFLEAAKYPNMTFVSSRITQTSKGFGAMGKLTVKGISRDATFIVTGLNDLRKDPWGHTRLGGKAEITIDRRNFGVGWNQPIDGGGILIGNEVEIIVDFELLQDK